LFAIDHRANYHFEKAYDWNYAIIKGTASFVPRSHPHFNTIQEEFITKNPWEMAFFTDPKVLMYHIEPLELVCPEKYSRLPRT